MDNLKEKVKKFGEVAQKDFKDKFLELVEKGMDDEAKFCARTVDQMCSLYMQAATQCAQVALKEFIEEEDLMDNSVKKNNTTYCFNKKCSKRFFTTIGSVSISRRIFRCEEDNFCPLDERWGMQQRFTTFGVDQMILLASASMDPKVIAEIFTQLTHFAWNKDTIYRIRTETGGDFATWYQSEEGQEIRKQSISEQEQPDIVVAGLDGANLAIRESSVAQGRPSERPQLKAENPDKKCCYKNAMVGSFSYYKLMENELKGGMYHQRGYCIYNAQMPQERFVDFKSEFEFILDSIEERLPVGTPKMLLLDGAKGLWGYINGNSQRYASYLKLLDFYHCAEHLSKLAELIFRKAKQKATAWFEKWKCKLKQEDNAIRRLIMSAQRYAKHSKLRTDIQREIGFFQRNKKLMNYRFFLSKGYPIGSGPTEAACKTIVKQRMCRSGMRWDPEKGNIILYLRSLEKSNQLQHMLNSFFDKKAA